MIERFAGWLEKVMGKILFDEFFWGEPYRGFDPEDLQTRVGHRLTEELQEEITDWGLCEQVNIFSSPHATPFQISVFFLDPFAPPIWGLNHQRGFEVFRVEISYPDFFSMTVFEDGKKVGGSSYCRNKEQLIKDAKEVLFYVLAKLMTAKTAK